MVIAWAVHPGWGGRYEISTAGGVRNRLTGRDLSVYPWSCPSGYVTLTVCLPGRRSGSRGSRRVRVSRLVLEAHVGSAPRGRLSYALHFNDDSIDCRLANLRWGSSWENAQDRIRNSRKVVADAA